MPVAYIKMELHKVKINKNLYHIMTHFNSLFPVSIT